MPRGGARAGAGRKPGREPAPEPVPAAASEAAAERTASRARPARFRSFQIIGFPASLDGLQPHEVLAAIARGVPMKAQYFDEETGAPIGAPFDHYPAWDQLIQCAIEAAPYFASKMASIQTYVPPSAGRGGSPDEVDASKLTDEELAAIVQSGGEESSSGGAPSSADRKAKPGRLGKRRKA